GISQFLVTGNYACPGTYPPSFNQPTTGFFVTQCAGLAAGQGNLGDIWRSIDGGATWTSARVGGTPPVPVNRGMGRINLAVATTPLPTTATVYAIGADQNGAHTVSIMKSVDSGVTWAVVAQGVGTTPTNPNPGATGADCLTMDIGHGQSQYDLTVA